MRVSEILILPDEDALWKVFQQAYRAAIQHYRLGAWYQDAHLANGLPTHIQFSALQAFWPGKASSPLVPAHSQ